CYYDGQGVSRNYTEAVKWYRKAAEQNYGPAQCNLGICYANGQGVSRNYTEAVEWYRKAAEQNYSPAQYNLSVCYAGGQGVPKDYIEAYKWQLLVAGPGNDEEAHRNVAILERLMTREQIAEGQRLARNFKPRQPPPLGSYMSHAAIAESRPQ